MLNGALILILGVLTLLGNDFVFTASGYGDDRVAVASLLGPLAPRAGWVLLCLGPAVIAVGLGLFKLKSWARRTLIAVLALAAVATAVVVAAYRNHPGVVASGGAKLAVYAVLLWYMHSAPVRRAFAVGR